MLYFPSNQFRKQGKKLRKLTVITLAISIIFGSAFSSLQVFAAAKDELQSITEQRKQIEKSLSGAEAQIATIMSEIEELNNEINQVNQAIAKNRESINKTEEDIQNKIDEISKLQKEIQELEADIEKRYEILDDRMSSYQKSGGSINYLDVLFGAQSFGDFISRVTMVNTITNADAELIDQIESDLKAVEEKKALSFENLEKLNDMKQKQVDTLAAIEEQKKQIESSKATLETKQNNLFATIKELKAKDSSLASLESEVKQTLAAEAAKAKELEQKASPTAPTTKHINGKTITVTSTAYTANCSGCTGITATGINLKENPDTKVIAVDPSVIPLGSVVYVEGYGYAIAGDIGSAIKGKKIDVFVPTKAKALQWGIRKVNVTIQ